ncbi:MAG: trehalose 6-phosphate synthase [Actinomycetota bacterium]|nr:trehalose 6-phosphate synthase [Actinomycetota bacterium]
MTGEPHPAGQHELIVVANRLPVDRKQEPDGSTSWHPSPGGLVAALEPVMRRGEGAWVGWSGSAGPAPEPFTAAGIRLLPVPLSVEEVTEYYEGMSNGTFWPLYHDVIVEPAFHRTWWDCYVTINRRFAEAVTRAAAQHAAVWVQDYQLQLVPRMLRERRPDLKIGFFNHIPFPPYEIFAQLPWRRQVLNGLLGADLLGFQRPADANNFLRACRRNGLLTNRGNVLLGRRRGRHETTNQRAVRCEAFPVSVDARMLDTLGRRADIQARARQIRRELGDPERLILGVDRLDYTKGIQHRLKAVGELFDEGRLTVPGTVMVQVATPSRERVDQYQQMREQVEVTVGRINGTHGRLGHPAVHYLHQHLDREELAALYLAADVMLITALRDGMNLVAKEYVATRYDERGALVLSEFTGAANELRQSYLINPHDIDGLKDVIIEACQAHPQEARRRIRAMRRRVFERDVERWADDFLRSLTGGNTTLLSHGAPLPPDPTNPDPMNPDPQDPLVRGEIPILDRPPILDRAPDPLPADGPPDDDDLSPDAGPGTDPAPDTSGMPEDSSPDLSRALTNLAQAQPLLVAMDFDGVLAPLVDDPQASAPLPEAVAALGKLAACDGVRVALVSGRTLTDLRQLAQPPESAVLVGSHGAQFQHPGAQESDLSALLGDLEHELLRRVTEELERIVVEHPGTMVELKPTAAVLHTRKADRSVAAAAAAAVLAGPAAWAGVHVTTGKEVIELSVVDVSKGSALRRLRAEMGLPAEGGILYAGDDVTDERAFGVLDDDAGDVTIKVGDGRTSARHRVAGPGQVAALLVELAGLREATRAESTEQIGLAEQNGHTEQIGLAEQNERPEQQLPQDPYPS